MLRFACWILVLTSAGWLVESAQAQAIIRPREFSLIRPTFPPNKPYSMPSINIKPVKQQAVVSTNNNARPTVFPSLRLTAVVPQGIQRQNVNFAGQIYQPGHWAGATPVATPKATASGPAHASAVSPAGSAASAEATTHSADSSAGGRRPTLDL